MGQETVYIVFNVIANVHDALLLHGRKNKAHATINEK